jgi:hypothetical protein
MCIFSIVFQAGFFPAMLLMLVVASQAVAERFALARA